jgi:hypothetical protein
MSSSVPNGTVSVMALGVSLRYGEVGLGLAFAGSGKEVTRGAHIRRERLGIGPGHASRP